MIQLLRTGKGEKAVSHVTGEVTVSLVRRGHCVGALEVPWLWSGDFFQLTTDHLVPPRLVELCWGMEELPSYIISIISRYEDPYQTTSIMESKFLCLSLSMCFLPVIIRILLNQLV